MFSYCLLGQIGSVHAWSREVEQNAIAERAQQQQVNSTLFANTESGTLTQKRRHWKCWMRDSDAPSQRSNQWARPFDKVRSFFDVFSCVCACVLLTAFRIQHRSKHVRLSGG
jgi:hypothetical protein